MSNLKPIRRQGIMNKNIGDEILLYDIQEGTIHILNKTAHMIWDLCSGHYTEDDIKQKLSDCFVFPAECDLRRDIKRTLVSFEQRGLLQHNTTR